MDLKKIKTDLSAFDRRSVIKASRVKLIKALCGLDMGDGSERAEYVCQDYILDKMGRMPRRVSIMFTYYPFDPAWPARSSEAYPDKEVKGQWEYPYDDYYPYRGGLNGDKDAEVFKQMRDIRRHGSDVNLTITVDTKVTDEHIRAIARDLIPFGRVRLRINHECYGEWFKHNQLYSYEEIGAFYERFDKILKEEAPLVESVFCGGCIDKEGKVDKEEAFLGSYRTADVWSHDNYLCLHYDWPFGTAEEDGRDKTFSVYKVEEVYEKYEKTVKRLREITGQEKKITMSEINADADVTGFVGQVAPMIKLLDMIEEKKPEWFDGLSFYQFRDRGGLGLELEDPNDMSVGHELPLLKAVKEVFKKDYYSPSMQTGDDTDIDGTFEFVWSGSEDAEGLEYTVKLDGAPVFFEVSCEKDANLIIEVNGKWFYKSAGVEVVNLMPAFFEENVTGSEIKLRFFAPPADGENIDDGHPDWKERYRYVMKELPKLRLRFKPAAVVL